MSYQDPLTGKFYSDAQATQEISAQAAEAEGMKWNEAMLTSAGRGIHNVYQRATGQERDQTADAAMEALREQRPVASAVGSMLPYLATAPLGGGIAAQAAIGAGTGALFAEQGQGYRDMALGAAGGAAGTMAGRLVGRLRNMFRSVPEPGTMGQEFVRTGGELTPAMKAGSRGMKAVEARLETNPYTGDVIEEFGQRNIRNANDLAGRAIGLPDSELRGVLDVDSMRLAGELLEDGFQTVAENANPVPVMGQQLADLRWIAKNNRYLNRRLNKLGLVLNQPVKIGQPARKSASEVLSPKQFMAIKSELAGEVANASGAEKTILTGMLDDLDTSFMQHNDLELRNIYRHLSGQYRTFQTLKKTGALSSEGNINPKSAFNKLANEFKDTVSQGKRYDDPAISDELMDLIDNLRAGSSQELTAPFGSSGTGERSMSLINPEAMAESAILPTYLKGKWQPYGFLDKAPAGYGQAGAAVGRSAPGLLGD